MVKHISQPEEWHLKCEVQLQDNPDLQLQVSNNPKLILTSV